MTGNVGRSLLEGAQAGQAMLSTPLDVMRLRQERNLRQQELDQKKAQIAIEMLKYGAADTFPQAMAMASHTLGQGVQQPQQNPLQNPVIQQRIQQQQQQAIGQAANNIEVKGDSDGLSFKGSAADVAMAAQHPVLGKIIRDAAAKNMQSSLPATSTQLAQPLTNPQSSKFQRFAKPTQETPQEAPQAASTPISPPTTAPMPPSQEGGQGEAIPEPDLSALEKPDVTLPQGTTMSMPKEQVFKDLSQIPSGLFMSASKEGVPTEKAGLTPTLLNFVKQQEGFSPKAYADGAQTSVGYGTRATSPDEKISEPEAVQRLSNELLQSREAVMTAAQQKGLQLAPNQLDALTSFDYNTGAGSRIISQAKSVQDIPQLMAQFTRAGNEHPQGLVNRRMAEIEMFNGGMNTAQAGLGGAPDFNLGQNVAKAQEALNQNPFSKPDYTNVIPPEIQNLPPQKQQEFSQAQQAGIPFVSNTAVDYIDPRIRWPELKQKQAMDNLNAERELYRKDAPDRALALQNAVKMITELDQFSKLNGVESTSPLKGEFNAVTKNVMSSPEWQRLQSLTRNLYSSIDKSGTQVRNLAEFNAFSQGMPNLSSDAKANAMTINTLRALAERSIDEITARDKYFNIKHTTDGFDPKWAQFSQDVPMLDYSAKGQPILNPERRNYQDYFRAQNVGQQPQQSPQVTQENAKVFNSHEEALKSGYRGRAIINGRPATIKD